MRVPLLNFPVNFHWEVLQARTTAWQCCLGQLSCSACHWHPKQRHSTCNNSSKHNNNSSNTAAAAAAAAAAATQQQQQQQQQQWQQQ
jgi:hypothetical protein